MCSFIYRQYIDLLFSCFLDGSDEVCEVREKCPDQAFQCSTPDPQATSTSRPMPSSNITLISDSTILSSLAAEFEAMRARKMPIKCISRAKLCDGVVDCTGKVAIFIYFIDTFLPAWLLYTYVPCGVLNQAYFKFKTYLCSFCFKSLFCKCNTSTHAMCPNFPHKVHTQGIFISIIITCCVQNFVYVCPPFPRR